MELKDIKQLLYSKKDGIGTITLNKPEKHNALSDRTLEELDCVLSNIEKDKEVRVVILKGAGKDFSSGHDWVEGLSQPRFAIGEQKESDFFCQKRETMDQLHRYYRWFWELPQPIIAQIHGVCMVLGLEVAMNCDLVIAAEDARFLYRPPGGTAKFTHLFPYLMGMRQAKELLWTKRWFTGAEAEKMGLINKAVPADQLEKTVNDLARLIIERSDAESVWMDKMCVNKVYELMGMKEGLNYACDIHAVGHTLPANKDRAERFADPKKGGKDAARKFFYP